ncbi:MAG: GTP cyclohydrolase I FolE [Candidatus Eisenbacteria bacterium]|uniref:GTP cyclohydrolase 1 n=1 Tax=Eiseniibacteriota bacterium TaxID=2212470 RepID=A0A938BPV7_UNCEI|nr:GTP cyclohydrolase I FolE [Candidatus Eisenbacteria bacterium]
MAAEVGRAGEVAGLVARWLEMLGEDPARPGLARTPARVAEALDALTRGYRQSLDEVIRGAVFAEPYDQMIAVKDIDFYSLCEHHLMPFFGKAHVAYIPSGRILGLSKIPRLVEFFSRRLQLQERLTTSIADCLQETLRPRGVGVVIEAFHLCVAMRGVEKQNAYMTTSAVLGDFRDDRATRAEFLALLDRRHRR